MRWSAEFVLDADIPTVDDAVRAPGLRSNSDKEGGGGLVWHGHSNEIFRMMDAFHGQGTANFCNP